MVNCCSSYGREKNVRSVKMTALRLTVLDKETVLMGIRASTVTARTATQVSNSIKK